MTLAEELAARSRFGVQPGLGNVSAALSVLGNPQQRIPAIHVAGTNGKGAVCAMLDAALLAAGKSTGRYTSPHLVRLNERFFLNGAPVPMEKLELISQRVSRCGEASPLTYFEFLTLLAFELYAETKPDFTVLETGLGGRLDATNVCVPALTAITRIGLDHCAVLGDTVEKIAAEKAGIIKPGVPIVLGRNLPEVIAVVKRTAEAQGAPFYYAPELAEESEIPADFSLRGSFNRENALTAIAALKVIGVKSVKSVESVKSGWTGLNQVVWPGRFQRIGDFLVDGAHNPPAARALVSALSSTSQLRNPATSQPYTLICGFCGDKEVEETLSILAPLCVRGFAVPIQNPRSLAPADLAEKMSAAGIPAVPCVSLHEAIQRASSPQALTLICGSLFLAGEALVELGAYPWGSASAVDLPDPAYNRNALNP